MTKPAPARLIGYFAKSAPVCIILRRGPSRYTLMIKWHTDTDVFEVGQWIQGRVNVFSMTSTGSHAAIGVMGGIARRSMDGHDFGQYAVVCRPPYFSAIAVRVGGLCYTYHAFDAEDRLLSVGINLKINANDDCQFEKGYARPLWTDEGTSCGSPYIDAIQGPSKGTDQSGREILFDSGKIFAIEIGEPRLLFDTNPLKFTQVEPPAWALTWNDMQEDSRK